MSQPNPFAEDPQLAQTVRLTSAADPLDPYAAPAGAGEYHRSLGPGLGLWRHEHELVMHCQAEFPPRCVLTNEPAEDLVFRRLAWAHPFDIGMTQQLMLRYAISPRGMRGQGHHRSLSIAVALSSLLGAGSLLWIARTGWQDFALIPLLLFAGLLLLSFVGSCKVAADAKRPLKLVARGGDYLWIIGAGPEFLASLPPWPRVKEFERP